MRRFPPLLAAFAIAAILAVGLVVVPQAAPHERTPLTANEVGAIVGLPVFSSDGKQVGKVLAEGLDEDEQPVIVAEIEQPLGIAPQLIAIPTYMFVRRHDRVVLTITAEEIVSRRE